MKHLDPKVIVVFFIKNFLGTVYILPIWFLGIFILEQLWGNSTTMVPKDVLILLLDLAGCIFFALLILGCYYWSSLTFFNFTYELQSDGLHIRSGIIIRRHIVIPYTDIDTVELLVNPFVVRFLDLYSLRIQTHELVNTQGVFRKKQTQIILGLASEEAKFLRVELLKDSHLVVKKTFFDPVSGSYR